MPVFEYKGLTKQGKNVKGTLDSENLRTARSRLKKDGIFVIDLKNKKETKKRKAGSQANASVGVQDLANMTRLLSTLLKANVPMVDSLTAVSEQLENPVLAEVMADIKNNVNEGGQLYKSLAKYPKIFDTIYVSMVEAGELSGALDSILVRLAEFTENQNQLESRVKSALYYPLFMFFFTGLLMVVIFVYVIPKMVTVFESAPELTLPWYTVAVIDFSNLLINYWIVIIAAIALGYLIFKNWKNTATGRKQYDRMLLNLPIIGKTARIVAVSRFTRTLSTLLQGGVPMLTAMGIVKNVVNNEILADAIALARDNISEGESVAGPLKKSGEFPPIVVHMINIGEKTGELENMLTQVSESYDFQVKTSIDGLTSLLSPLTIILMGGVIGIIVFAIMVPMFQMSNLGG